MFANSSDHLAILFSNWLPAMKSTWSFDNKPHKGGQVTALHRAFAIAEDETKCAIKTNGSP
jgi:hypothetical protein